MHFYVKIDLFLKELGDSFAFIEHRYRLKISDQRYVIYLLLYHRGLRCLVAIQLKNGKFIPEYADKMQFYLTALDETEKLADENPSIGIILCRSKSKTVVEIVKKIPEELKDQLPTIEQIEKLLLEID